MESYKPQDFSFLTAVRISTTFIAMTLTKPYKRLWRPVKGYNAISLLWEEPGQPKVSLDYLRSDLFVDQQEKQSYLTTTHLIIRDLYELFNYIQPHDNNLNVFSHRIYELLLRTATEFEANCKAILTANGYQAKGNFTIKDYFKIASAAKLSDYIVSFGRWETPHAFKPYELWNGTEYQPLPWYQAYNSVKHNRHNNFSCANLDNLMNAIAGLLCILHAQFGEDMAEVCFEQLTAIPNDQQKVKTSTFVIQAPVFKDKEMYEFIWEDIESNPNPVAEYSF